MCLSIPAVSGKLNQTESILNRTPVILFQCPLHHLFSSPSLLFSMLSWAAAVTPTFHTFSSLCVSLVKETRHRQTSEQLVCVCRSPWARVRSPVLWWRRRLLPTSHPRGNYSLSPFCLVCHFSRRFPVEIYSPPTGGPRGGGGGGKTPRRPPPPFHVGNAAGEQTTDA